MSGFDPCILMPLMKMIYAKRKSPRSRIFLYSVVSPEKPGEAKYHRSRAAATFSPFGAETPSETWPTLLLKEFSLDGRNIWKP